MDPPKRAMLLPPPPAVKKEAKTYCFELKLGESNDETYPEFSWKDLVRDAQRKETASKVEKGGTALDPYASDDEDDLKAMAARFEEKYNNKSDTGKLGKRKRRAEDYIDRGAGYDLEDPFIDNNDIYDEVVPEDMEPVHGGFYINSGSLDYKEVEVSDCDDEELEKNKKSKQTDAPKLTKPNKNQLPAGVVKRRRSSTNGVASRKLENKETKPDKNAPNKTETKNQKENSRSTSPACAVTKKKPSTVILSSSDSSSSSSEDSSSTDSSDSDSDSGGKKEVIPTTTKPKLKLQTCTTFREIIDPKSKPRLKVKNVPLNPKLHGGKVAEDPKAVKPISTVSPMSNRDIFGASQSMANISSLNIPSGLSATSMTLSATNLSKLSASSAGLRTISSVKHNINSKPRKVAPGRPRVVDTALKQAALAAMTLGEPQMKKQRKPRVSSAPAIRQQGIKLNAKHGSVISPGERVQNFRSESAGEMPTLTPYPATSMSILSESAKSKINRKSNSPATLSGSAHQNFGQLGSGITVTEVHDKISRPPTLTPAPQLVFNSSITSNNNRTTTPPTFTLSGGSPTGISLPSSITITTPAVCKGSENHRTNSTSRQTTPSTSIITPSTSPGTHGKLLKPQPQHITPFDVNALLAHSSSGGLKSNSSDRKSLMMGQLSYQQREREGQKK